MSVESPDAPEIHFATLHIDREEHPQWRFEEYTIIPAARFPPFVRIHGKQLINGIRSTGDGIALRCIEPQCSEFLL